MNVQDVMSAALLTVSPDSTLRAVAQRMSERNAGAALLVNASTGTYSGIIAERDMLNAIAAGKDPERERVAENATADIVTIQLDASLERAAEKMLQGEFRHLLVVSRGDAVGIVSMRDLMRALTSW